MGDKKKTKIEKKAEELAKKAMKALEEKSTQNTAVAKVPVKKKIKTRGRAAVSVIEEAQLSLFNMERQGRFHVAPLKPESEFPSLLTRLPIFLPSNRSTQKQFINSDLSISFETSWGKGKKFGSPLTVYDEDTLIALMRLRQKRLIGEPQNLPISVSGIFLQKGKRTLHADVLNCMISQIQEECGKIQGGKANRERLESVKRLSTVTVQLDAKSTEKYLNKGTTIKLLDVLWEEWETNGVLYVQFHPVVTYWLEDSYTYINWKIRLQLSSTGKAIHRFLSGQPRTYEIMTKKLQETIGFHRPQHKFMEELRKTSKKLVELGWLSSYEITGTGKKTPFKLKISRD